MKILVIGDIFGKAGRQCARKAINRLKKQHKIDLVIANGENLAHGSGMTPKTYREMLEYGVDFFTTGNHITDKEGIFEEMKKEDSLIIRPANFKKGNPGKGFKLLKVGREKILIINLMGRVFMNEEYDCPFKTADKILKKFSKEKLDAILIDFHAEATSEKIALRHYLDGRATALWGTHTHIPTADAEITKKGMGYITDIGMTGPEDSVIGVIKENIIESFLKGTKFKLEPASGRCVFNCIMIEITGLNKCKSINLIQLKIN